MKRVFLWIGAIIGVVALAVAGFAGWIAASGLPSYDVDVPPLRVASSPERIARGRELAMSLCFHCHADPVTKVMTGRPLADLPVQFGMAASKNITKDMEHGIGSWTDGEIAWAVRTGIQPRTGTYMPPWMPKFAHMSDEDMASIIAFLRSDDPMVAASPVPNQPSAPSFLAKLLCRIAFKPMPYPDQPIIAPDTTDPVARGKYLTTAVYDCYACHSADIATVNPMQPELSEGFFGGGTMMPEAGGNTVPTANITFDRATGIGSWTEEQFVTAMRHAKRPDGSVILYPMARMPHVSDGDLRSMYAYLKTVPRISAHHPQPEAYAEATSGSKGQRAYYRYGCQTCHGKTGLGIADLTLASKRYPDDSTMLQVILRPDTYYPETIMPVWDGVIKTEDQQELVAYVRSLGKR